MHTEGTGPYLLSNEAGKVPVHKTLPSSVLPLLKQSSSASMGHHWPTEAVDHVKS